jgi:ketosteroid isomerase-like protein
MSKGYNSSLNNLSDEDQIRQMEIEWGDAFLRRDIATLDRLMADEYILTDPLGSVRGKAESLAAIETNEVLFESTESDNVNVLINGDTAVVTARSTFRGRYKGWSVAGRYQYTDVLVKRRGAWKAVGSHITALGVGALRLRVGRFVSDWLVRRASLRSVQPY